MILTDFRALTHKTEALALGEHFVAENYEFSKADLEAALRNHFADRLFTVYKHGWSKLSITRTA